MEITKKEVALAAQLAKMRVSEREAAVYQSQLEALFDWVKELAEVNTDGVDVSDFSQAACLRADTPVTNTDLNRTLISAFSEEKENCAKVKKVL